MSEATEVPAGTMTVGEFHRWARAQPRGRFELSGGAVVAMAPARIAHVRAKARAWLALRDAVARAGVPCEALNDGAAVRVGDDTLYEPDAVVTCREIGYEQAVEVPDPVVVVEVTSPSNSRVDLTTKFADYFRLPSVRHYLIVHLARRLVIHHRRAEDGQIGSAIARAGPLALDPPGIEVRVEDLIR